LPDNQPLVDAIQRHGKAIFSEAIAALEDLRRATRVIARSLHDLPS